VGYDRKPATFIVYLFLPRQAALSKRDAISVSLQTIATKTGLSKSTVQRQSSPAKSAVARSGLAPTSPPGSPRCALGAERDYQRLE
jgi:hypothetical protein